ncbi:chaperonin 10-like protein [Zychaea mexicana]|uniref:chaperonin 10-like protein n=1 Tax=Zychaea mexicana TaxID=64656 RepID=UPI0022FED65E|nr:chaperonin 10-like protein [Zychaea mexicana]KAI9477139.1 chaperonin 10-like protein [Zychaea mexicana]
MTNDKFTGYAALKPIDGPTLESMTFDARPLEEDEVEIRVQACGICGSDVHHLTNGWGRATYPLIPGHEFIGDITAVGNKVTEHKVGDRVGVSPVCRSCNECEQCTTQHKQLCPSKVTTYNGKYKGQMTYGGYADRVRVQSTWAIKVPENISSEEGAPLLCAGVTTFLPFKHQNIGEQHSVGIVGIGGLGHLAVQWARAKNCSKVLAFSSSDAKREEAFKLGATEFATLSETAKYQQSVDYLFVCGSGKSTNWTDLLGLIKLRGKLVLLDIPEEPVPFNAGAFVYKHISIIGSYVGSSEDLQEMLEFASKTGVRPWIDRVGNSLEEVNRGLGIIMSGKAHYRVVICGEGRQ